MFNLLKRNIAGIRKIISENIGFSIFLTVWILAFLLLRTLQHFSFGTNALDLSLFDYSISNTLSGRIMYEPFATKALGSHFALHFSPIIFFITPFYLFFKGPLFLIYIQVFIVGLSAVPFYLIAEQKLNSKRLAAILAAVYLIYRPLINGLMYDFHPETFFPLFFFSSIYFLYSKKNMKFYYLFLFLSIFIREDFAIYILFLGIFLLLRKDKRITGLITISICLIYIFAVFFFFIPLFRSAAGLHTDYGFLANWKDYGNSGLEIIGSMITQPIKVLTEAGILNTLMKSLNLIGPLLLIPFLSSWSILAIPPLLIAALSRIPLMSSFGIYYSYSLFPFLFISVLFGLYNLRSKTKNTTSRLIAKICVLMILINIFNFNWKLLSFSKYNNIAEYSSVKELINKIPGDASVSSLSSLIPHIPKREKIYFLPNLDDSDYVLIKDDINKWPMSPSEFEEIKTKLYSDTKYRVTGTSGTTVLFKKYR
jgi:uncharacterized membrane protein